MVLKKKVCMISSHLSSFWLSYFVVRTNFVLLANHYAYNFSRENVASVVNIVMRDFIPRLLFCWVGLINTCLFLF